MARVSADARETTRARLLAAAAEEFGRAGLERASVDEISLAAGYAKGTIYNYFPSKEELFLAVVEEASAQADSSSPARHDAPARERLRATLAGFCAWAGRYDALARVLALAIAGLTDLALAQHWASGGTRPGLEEIPELVLTLLLGPPPAGDSP